MRKIALVVFSILLISCAFEDPYFSTIEVHHGPCTIRFDDSFTDLESLEWMIYSKKQSLDSIQNSKYYLKLKYSENVTKTMISDIENILRRRQVSKVKYYQIDKIYCRF